MTPVLSVDHLTKQYKSFSLKGISFCLEEGKITGFIGVNGAGKTTTIRTILGLAPIDSGKIYFFGNHLLEHEKSIKDRVGLVLDDGGFYEDLTLNQMKSIIAPSYSRWNENEFNKYLLDFDLNKKQKISKLSKGMKMKYALALALSHDADLLIMDEPTSGLDPLIRSQLLEILKKYVMNKNKSVFFSTHITSDLDKIADELILIDDGRILFQEKKESLLKKYSCICGKKSSLSKEQEGLILFQEETNETYRGLIETSNIKKNKFEKVYTPTIEDIMLAFIRRNNEDPSSY